MKSLRWICLVCCAALLLTGCGAFGGGTSEAELYEIGMGLIETMEEMTQSEAYREFMSTRDWSGNVTTKLYREPAAVYRVYMGDLEEILELGTDREQAQWDQLSDNLQEQLAQRFTFMQIVSNINSSVSGPEALSYSSVYHASQSDKSLQLEETVNYLYVFSSGTCVAVSFTELGSVQGCFLFLKDCSRAGLEELFDSCKCSLETVNW